MPCRCYRHLGIAAFAVDPIPAAKFVMI